MSKNAQAPVITTGKTSEILFNPNFWHKIKVSDNATRSFISNPKKNDFSLRATDGMQESIRRAPS
jgi:hypothetical protein